MILRSNRRDAAGTMVTAGRLLAMNAMVAQASVGPSFDSFAASNSDTLRTLLDKDPRSITGFQNNLDEGKEEWGMAETPFIRKSPVAYENGHHKPSGPNRPNPRSISNAISAQGDATAPNSEGASDLLWQWGQFVDHDLALGFLVPHDLFNIFIPAGDETFDPDGTGEKEMLLERTRSCNVRGVREQVNSNTAFLDASQVYGSDDERASALREHEGGRLRSTQVFDEDGGTMASYLPYNTNGLPNFPHDHLTDHFLAGDVRVTEQLGLTAMHTIWLREHNHIAGVLEELMFPEAMTDEQIYQLARRIVIAEVQHITFDEFLPLLLGPDVIPDYQGYDPTVDPGIATEFATAAYRVGHTFLPPRLQHCESKNSCESLELKDAFFVPHKFVELGGPEAFLLGQAKQICQEVDVMIVDGVRQFLFEDVFEAHPGGFDLPALNIQRGRDHGIGTYNDVRDAYGLDRRTSFEDVNANDDAEVVDRLGSVYESVEDIDPWIGCVAEDHYGNAMVGETILTIVEEQFRRLRDGDRFWYEHDLPASLIQYIQTQTLAKVINRNMNPGASQVQENAMVV